MLLEQWIILALGIIIFAIGIVFMIAGILFKNSLIEIQTALALIIYPLNQIIRSLRELPIRGLGVTELIEALAKFIDVLSKFINKIAKYIPNALLGLGLFMVVIGALFIFLAFYLPIIPNISNANTTLI